MSSDSVRYWEPDVAALLHDTPYLQLARPSSAVRFLRYQVDAGRELADVLAQCPRVRVQALEFFYTCLRSLAALDGQLARQLATATWRGAVWLAWLSLLEPAPRFVPVLARARASVPDHNHWLLDAAISGRAASMSGASQKVAEFAGDVRELLGTAVLPRPPLRREPCAAQRAIMEAERERVRDAYHRLGASAAREVMRGTTLEYYAVPYRRWRQSMP